MLIEKMNASLPVVAEVQKPASSEVYNQHQAELSRLSRNHDRLEAENKLLRERIQQLEHQIYGRKSEKYSLDEGDAQPFLFEESKSIDNSNELAEEEDDEVIVPEHKRKKSGRKALPASFPREIVVHDLSEEEKICGCGCQMSRIGEEASEELEMEPARFRVVRHVRYKYACKNCDGVDKAESEKTVKIAAAPVKLIPRSIATPSLLSHIFVSKYCDGLPFYRQKKQFSRMGVDILRTTMCNWLGKVSYSCEGLLELLKNEILSGPIINIDETTFQVLHEPGRRVSSKSYMWVYRGGAPDRPTVFYEYAPTRSGEVALEFLGNYQGYIQTDGYAGYGFLDKRAGITHVGCWAHVRRKFKEVVRAGESFSGRGLAIEALNRIGRLYRIEKLASLNELSAEELCAERQKYSRPLLEEFELWLKANVGKVPPRSLLGKAFSYALGQWPRLVEYVNDGRLRMDNNLAENAIRPFVVGRKNWLFNDRPWGAQASASLYSIIETVKTNNLEPFKYLCHLFDRLPFVQSEEDLRKLLPQNLTREFLNDQYTNRFRWD